MPFQYVASTADGRLIEGVLDTAEEVDAEKSLEKAGYRVLRLRSFSRRPSMGELFPSVTHPTASDIIALLRQLSILLETGTPLLSAVQVLRQQAIKPGLQSILTSVIQSVQSGSTMSDALRQHPNAFNQLTVRMIEMGERSGGLEQVLRQVAGYIDRERAIAKKLMKALVYPAIVVTVAVAVVILILTFVLPQISKVFLSLKVNLPWTTLVMMRLSDFLVAYGLYLALAVVALGIATKVYISRPAGRRRFHRLLLSLPLIGSLLALQATARLSRTMAMLLHAGIPISDALVLTRATVSNVVLNEALAAAQEQLLQGQGLAVPLGRVPYFPPLFIQMVRVGEESGTLESNLTHVADSYEQEVEERIDSLVSLIEPALTLGIGVLVAFIALSVILPMFSMGQALRK
ncbi:MAG: type II secretion system F family protein [Dehalococcoidia bacterium]|nr:type II secretion system F family protein [Dehalococcoidia bacterium]